MKSVFCESSRVSSGAQFGRLKVVGRVFRVRGAKSKDSKAHAVCVCDCGMVVCVAVGNLTNGHTHSCGCLNRDIVSERNTIHGHSTLRNTTPEYDIWSGIITRCENPRTKTYPRYGGRGIRMCQRWRESFVAFFNDMGPRPSNKHSIDRIDTNGNYEPGNCRWATQKDQCRNRQKNNLVTAFGRTQCVAAWAEETGLSDKLIYRRISRGWSGEKAVSTPRIETYLSQGARSL